VARVGHAARCAADRDHTVLHRLAQHFQRAARKLRELIQEQRSPLTGTKPLLSMANNV
jgi:hypothetical protein